MATTDVSLYRSVMGNKFKSIKSGVYPGDGILSPQFVEETFYSKKLQRNVTRAPDLTVEVGKDGPEVLPDGGTSLHDVAGWFPSKEFWIPEGTEYSAEINIVKDAKKKTNPGGTVSGHHYQLEPKTRMTQLSFEGALNNMARAAVARQVLLAKTGVR